MIRTSAVDESHGCPSYIFSRLSFLPFLTALLLTFYHGSPSYLFSRLSFLPFLTALLLTFSHGSASHLFIEVQNICNVLVYERLVVMHEVGLRTLGCNGCGRFMNAWL